MMGPLWKCNQAKAYLVPLWYIAWALTQWAEILSEGALCNLCPSAFSQTIYKTFTAWFYKKYIVKIIHFVRIMTIAQEKFGSLFPCCFSDSWSQIFHKFESIWSPWTHGFGSYDLLCKVHNLLKRLFGHEKNWQLTDYRSRYRFF